MANLALIRGAAMAAPKFTDIRGAVEPGIQTFKNIQALKQKEAEEDEAQRKREDQIKFNLYANLPGLEDDLVPDKFKNIATQKALDIRQQQRNLINNKDSMDQFEFIDQMNKLNKQVGNLNKDFNAYKEWSANWVDLKDSDDLSSGMSAKDRKTILDLVTGDAEPIMTDEGAAYKTADGTVHLLKNLPKPISIAYDKHLGIYNEMAKIGEGFGKAGVGNDDPAYINRKTAVLANFKRGLTTEDALSLGADFLKVGGLSGEYSGLLKNISEDPSLIENYEFDDRDEFGKVIGKIKGIEGYKEFITDQYGQIADNMNSTLKKKYDQALAVKKPTPSKPTESEIERRLTSAAAQKYSLDISKFKNELGIAVNPAGIAIGDATNATLDIESPNFSNLANKLGFRISSIYRKDPEDKDSDIQSIELKQQGGNKTFEVVPGQNTISFLEQAFLMQGVNRLEVPQLINNVLYGTFIPPSQEINTDYEN